MKKGMLLFLLGMGLVLSMFNSCEEDPSLPTAVIYATIDGYQVSFAPTVTDASTYTWDFGDESGTSTEANPVYTYESFGEYTVSLTVTGDGGSVTVTKVITIEATSVKDLLTGGAAATNGKTWVLSTVTTVGYESAGTISSAPYEGDVLPFIPDNALTDILGLGAEYDNEYTFYFDGTYKMNLKNGKALAGLLFSNVAQLSFTVGSDNGDNGLCSAEYTLPTSSTWTLNTNDLVLDDVVLNATDFNDPPVHGPVTISSDYGWISLSTDAFFGVLDFSTTTQFVIDEISTDKLQASLFLCGYATNPEYFMLPNTMLHLTFVKK